MALNKVNYVDNETIITAQNLNDIQDNIIYKDYVSDIFAITENCICKYDPNTKNSPYTAGLTNASDGICIITSVGDYASYICYPTSHSIVCMAIKTPDGYQGWYNLDLEKNYPPGSIYMTISNNSPAYLFGGTWERIDDRFLLGAGTSYTAGSTGGEATHTLTINEIPSHNHNGANKSGNIGYSGDITAGSTNYSFRVDYGLVSDRTDLNIHVAYNGGGWPHNNMPPYYAVYIWRRVS